MMHGFCVAAIVVAGVLLGPRMAEAQCTYKVSPLTQAVLSTGTNGSVSVITGSACTWTGTSAVSWITVASGSHAGLGSVSYSVAVNSTTSARTGTMTVAGQTVTINQAFGSCSYTVSPLNQSVPSTAFNGSVRVTTGSSCTWTGTSAVDWITVASGSHAGLGSVTYAVAANSIATARTGTLTVAGRDVTINQAAGNCSYSVSPTTGLAPLSGADGSVSVTTGSGCAWTAASSVDWMTITGGASGIGLASFTYTVAPGNMLRTGTLTVAGQTVTITQGTGETPAMPSRLRIIR